MDQKQTIKFIHLAYLIGIIADGISTIILLSPNLSQSVFGLTNLYIGEEYLYVSRIAASLMLGWTILLLWAYRKPVERRFILLLTIIPVVICIMFSGIIAVNSGLIPFQNMLPLWIFNTVLVILYIFGYLKAGELTSNI